jgi:hypothetical protein
MNRISTEIVNYINPNIGIQREVIIQYREEWFGEYNISVRDTVLMGKFRKHLLETYGIDHHVIPFDDDDFYIVDEKKYMVFQMKYAV